MEPNAGSNFISNYQLLEEFPITGINYFDINVVLYLVSILHNGKILGHCVFFWSRNTGIRNF